MTKFEAGDRVFARAINGVARDYQGLTGRVVAVHAGDAFNDRQPRYLVKFDNPPPDRITAFQEAHGGSWSDESLEADITDEDVAAAIRSILGGTS